MYVYIFIYTYTIIYIWPGWPLGSIKWRNITSHGKDPYLLPAVWVKVTHGDHDQAITLSSSEKGVP